MSAPKPGPARNSRLPRSPFAYAALAVALVHLTGALPFQIDWAGRTGADAAPESALDALRLLTVSPVRRFSTATGPAALGLEALWTVCFLFLLTAATRALAARTTLPPRDPESAVTRAYAHIAAWPVLAPAAHLPALALTRLPELSFDPTLRGNTAYTLFLDVRAGLGHTVLLGLIGGFAAATALLAFDPDIAENAPPTGPRDQLRRFRGPLSTLWPRIGATLLATAAGALVLDLVANGLPGHVLDPVARFWCAPSEIAQVCGDDLVRLSGLDLPEFPGGEPLLVRFSRLYAWQAFVLLFAVTHFAVASLTHALPRPARAALAAWCGYTAGAIGFGAVARAVSALWESPTRSLTLDQILGLLLPPTGLNHALYTAPFAALLCAALTRVRFRRRKEPEAADEAPAETDAARELEAAASEADAAAPAHGNRLA
ncbi:hypothetical protein OG422_18820 [Streptomyces sp. NBC_01525]|uniref:hypothetical protein n=1 Tax=Streptomyces sp. NBC_01525 TaxID=2903893 RepID=UPI00386B58F4